GEWRTSRQVRGGRSVLRPYQDRSVPQTLRRMVSTAPRHVWSFATALTASGRGAPCAYDCAGDGSAHATASSATVTGGFVVAATASVAATSSADAADGSVASPSSASATAATRWGNWR